MSPFFDDLERQLHAAAAQQAAKPPARWWRRRRNLAIVAILTAGIATPALSRVTGVWDPHVAAAPPAPTVTVSSSATRSCHDAAGAEAVRKGARLDPRLVAQLAVLRRPQRASDAARKLGGGYYTVLPGTERYVGSIGDRRFYLAGVVERSLRRCGERPRGARPTQLCLMQRGGSGGCGLRPVDLRAQGMLVTSGLSARRSTVAAVVPDDVIRVTARYGASVRSFRVRDNFFGYEVAVPADRFPDLITWTMRDGSRRELPRGG
jgi:hypothetical protein